MPDYSPITNVPFADTTDPAYSPGWNQAYYNYMAPAITQSVLADANSRGIMNSGATQDALDRALQQMASQLAIQSSQQNYAASQADLARQGQQALQDSANKQATKSAAIQGGLSAATELPMLYYMMNKNGAAGASPAIDAGNPGLSNVQDASGISPSTLSAANMGPGGINPYASDSGMGLMRSNPFGDAGSATANVMASPGGMLAGGLGGFAGSQIGGGKLNGAGGIGAGLGGLAGYGLGSGIGAAMGDPMIGAGIGAFGGSALGKQVGNWLGGIL
jgi:hypothetical protein